ncbi:hypothetical protein BH10CHL1_BH10CHL1_02210 [soil metagenome]
MPLTTSASAVDSLPVGIALESITLSIGSRDWCITSVRDEIKLMELTQALAHPPYGFRLWESAVGLAHWLAERPAQLNNKRVLELGTGVGLPGLVAASLGAEVWQTDHQPGVLHLAQLNATQNQQPPLPQFVADWRMWEHAGRYDLIIGADILYEHALHFYLERIFHHNLVPGGRLLLTDPGRTQALDFAIQLEEHGWQIDLATRPVASIKLGAPTPAVGITLLTARLAKFSSPH